MKKYEDKAIIIYGRAYKTPKHRNKDVEGVSYLKAANKWLVRIKNKKGYLTTLKAFENKVQADDFYSDYMKQIV